VRIRLGDCFAIPLPDGRYGYCQLLASDTKNGYLIRVFDKTTSKMNQSTDSLRDIGEMFPPVFVGLRASVRSGRWKPIGQLPIPDFKFPRFRYRRGGLSPGVYDNWMVLDGQHYESIGRLPPELRSIEHELVWGDESLEKRIATRRNPYAGAQ
jgi:hypothetical protein